VLLRELYFIKELNVLKKIKDDGKLISFVIPDLSNFLILVEIYEKCFVLIFLCFKFETIGINTKTGLFSIAFSIILLFKIDFFNIN